MNFSSKAEMQAAHGQVMDCDFCGVAMDFERYRKHECPGLNGRNPLDEKLKGAKWKVPASMKARGSVVNGVEVTPEALFNPEAKVRRRARRLAVVGMVLWFGMGVVAGALLW